MFALYDSVRIFSKCIDLWTNVSTQYYTMRLLEILIATTADLSVGNKTNDCGSSVVGFICIKSWDAIQYIPHSL